MHLKTCFGGEGDDDDDDDDDDDQGDCDAR